MKLVVIIALTLKLRIFFEETCKVLPRGGGVKRSGGAPWCEEGCCKVVSSLSGRTIVGCPVNADLRSSAAEQ